MINYLESAVYSVLGPSLLLFLLRSVANVTRLKTARVDLDMERSSGLPGLVVSNGKRSICEDIKRRGTECFFNSFVYRSFARSESRAVPRTQGSPASQPLACSFNDKNSFPS